MEAPEVRIGWLRMLRRVYLRAGAELYRELVVDLDRLIADAERERAARRPSRLRRWLARIPPR
jgi:hypothetical protein